jgi:hypothetical protein
MQAIPSSTNENRVCAIRVHAGKASDPISKFRYQLRAPLRWWSYSAPRIAAHEIGKIALRILAIPDSLLAIRAGLRVTPNIPDAYKETPRLANMLPHACISGMEKLDREHRWFGVLDQRTYSQGFCEGVEGVLHILGNKYPDKG